MGTALRFVWFWTFWHWSKESFRAEMLLRGPIDGVACNWDEWFHHEASDADRAAILEVDANERGQRDFVAWLLRTWAPEAVPGGNCDAPAFVLRELAQVAPFNRWSALQEYREPPERTGICAIVLAEGSPGRSSDVRPVEAVVLPVEPPLAGGTIAAVDFQMDTADLNASRQAVLAVLRGGGLARLLARWAAVGPRAYPRGLAVLLNAGWLGVAALLAYLLFGPEPGSSLPVLSAVLVVSWASLVLVALVAAGRQIRAAAQAGKQLARHLDEDEVQITIPGKLALKGGSAGFAVSLNVLLALHRAYPHAAAGSWLWRRFFARLGSGDCLRAATGVITPEGRVAEVLVEPKLRACAEQNGIGELLVPTQPEANQRRYDAIAGAPRADESPPEPTAPGPAKSAGFAAVTRRSRVLRCHHLAAAIARIGALSRPGQAATNAAALGLSFLVLAALPDLGRILVPPPPPLAVPPSSPSPYFLWVSLDTRHPDFFQVVLESRSWLNRRANVAARNSTPASVRAEIRLVRSTRLNEKPDFEEGTVWIERRPRLLWRDYAPTERVGRYSLRYLLRLRHD